MQSRKRESSLVIFVKAFPPHLVGIMVVQIALINGHWLPFWESLRSESGVVCPEAGA